MTSTLKVDQIQLTDGNAPTAADLGFAAGSVLQVVSAHKSDPATANSVYPTWSDIGFEASITPTSATSKILMISNLTIGNNSAMFSYHRILRDGTVAIDVGDVSPNQAQVTSTYYQDHNGGQMIKQTSTFLDSPATTSQVTYKIQVCGASNSIFYLNRSGRDGAYTQYDGRGASNIILMEIAG